LTDGPNRKAAEIIYLECGEAPPGGVPWLIIVKTHGCDFELVFTAGLQFRLVTLGTDPTLEAALERAMQAAETCGVNAIYVTRLLDE
jgi:hypothetical protein